MTLHDTTTDLDAFTREWEDWHAQSEARLAAPHGFLAITGLHWLTDEPQRFEDAPGTWTTGSDGPRVVLDEGDEIVVDGVPITGGHRFGVIPERGGVNAEWRGAVLEVAKRGGHDIVRPRHPDAALRNAFHGTPAYAPDPRWAVTGRYVPFAEPRPTTVGAAVDNLEHVYDAPGRIEFSLDGQDLALTAFPGHAPGSLLVLEDGAVRLDFNRAGNLPCAYTDLATCPLPPEENRLPVAIEAGHRIPYERGGS